jgi:beta-lactamase domain protein
MEEFDKNKSLSDPLKSSDTYESPYWADIKIGNNQYGEPIIERVFGKNPNELNARIKERLDDGTKELSIICSIYFLEKQERPFSDNVIGLLNPYTQTIIETESDYHAFLWDYAKEQAQIQNNISIEKRHDDGTSSKGKGIKNFLEEHKTGLRLASILLAVLIGAFLWDFFHQGTPKSYESSNGDVGYDIQERLDLMREDGIKNTVVYVSDQGEKYHAKGCRYLRDGYSSLRLEEAVDKGYTPCSVCNPPRP